MIRQDILEHLAELGSGADGAAERAERLWLLIGASDGRSADGAPVSAAEQIAVAVGAPPEALPAIRAELNRPVDDGDPLPPAWLTLLLFRLTVLETAVAWFAAELARCRAAPAPDPVAFTVHSTTAN